jgi:hypothetical protein
VAIVEGLRLLRQKNELVTQAKDGTLTDAGREELFEALKSCREWLGIEAEKLARPGELFYSEERESDGAFEFERDVTLVLGEHHIPYGRLCYNGDWDGEA